MTYEDLLRALDGAGITVKDDLAAALDPLTAAISRGSGLLLDRIGIVVRVADTLEPYAREHQPHLLRSRAKRQRKKAVRELGRTMPREHRMRAFQVAALRRAEAGR